VSTTAPDEVGRDAGMAVAGKHELDKWNWGAFLWGGIWAIGHRLWAKGIIGLLLTLIPLVGIVVGIVFALKGNRWIWERGGYDSHEELRAKERKWAWAYLWFVLAVFAIGFVVGLAG